jgi:primosomal protein N' (replication factor Y)
MQKVTYFVDVIVPLGVPNKYTYRVPAELNGELKPGKRVLVQFGKTRIYTGIIYHIHQTAPAEYEAKYLEGILDEEPVVTELQLRFWDWISFYYCAGPGDVMNAALPSGLKLSSTSHIQLNPDFNFEETEHHDFTEREHLILEALHSTPNLSFDDLSRLLELKAVQPLVHRLLKKNAIVVYEDVKDKYKPKLQAFVRLHETYSEEAALQGLLSQLEKKAFKQAEALLYFLHLRKSQPESPGNWIRKTEVLKKADSAAITALVKKNVLEEQSFEVGRLLFEKGRSVHKALSGAQQQALSEIRTIFSGNKPAVLHGVTGSGKTEVYIQLIRETLEQHRSVLFLIPEIALTTQLITRLRAVFGEIVGVYHSRFSENERVEIWNNVLRQGQERQLLPAEGELPDSGATDYRIILGARSSLFLPFHNLGLIIVDEEHDYSFKQHDPSPRYQARDAALYLASLHQAQVLLGSATPSVESIYNCRQEKYGLAELSGQFAEGGGTQIELCNVNQYTNSNEMRASLTPPLFEAIGKALEKKKQVILFQNRRGFAPYTECKACGHVPQCVQCDVSLIYHKHSQKLSCHYCGYSVTPPKTCPACGSNQLHYKGMGTEKIEEDMEILFPGAKIARMDLDSTRSKYAYKQLIDDFENGQIDILVGTQMVTKGLDFNNVSVVGVLNADAILNFPDFRSFEKAFQLLTQVRGRAGRKHEIGHVYIQTTQPEHHILRYITANQTAAFYEDTLAERRQYHYPPYSRLFELTLISKDPDELNHLAAELFRLLKPAFGEALLGPEFPLISRIKNQYHKRILIKTPRQQGAAAIRQNIYTAINELQHLYKNWRYRVAIDVDPV